MLTFIKEIKNTLTYPIYQPYKIDEVIFFDIETTGLSAKTSLVYLIGCMYYQEENWHLLQWLISDPNNEKDLLIAFAAKLKTYKRIIHYNGSGFDIPYLTYKYKSYNIESPFSSIDSLDIYKAIIPYKRLFPLPNYKLQTLQKYLGFKREDNSSGDQLIKVYTQYIGMSKVDKLRTYNSSPGKKQGVSKELQDILLLHNYDDIAGMLECSNILAYIDFLSTGTYSLDNLEIKHDCKDSYINISIRYPMIFPYKIEWLVPFDKGLDPLHNDKKGYNYYLVKIEDRHINIRCPLVRARLKYFFDNYRDYYYLPLEDTAIHKSLATYVDKDYKTKAKPSNCYTPLESIFVPIAAPSIFKEYNIKTFKDDYNSSSNYIELDSITSSNDNLVLWLESLLENARTNKNTLINQ